MKYLLTGSSGFLGKRIRESLLSAGHELITLGRTADHDIRVDLGSDAVGAAGDIAVDVVVHCAGKAHMVPRTKEEAAAFFEVNLEGTKRLCSLLRPGVTRSFIFISTVAVYGVDAGEMIGEEHPLNGNTPYALSKIQAEQWLTAWARENNVVLGILRLPLIAGIDAPGNLGQMVKGIKSGRYLSIGKANARKSMVWDMDVAQIIPALARTGGTYNLTDGMHPTFGELEACISGSLGKGKPMAIPLIAAKLLAKVGDLSGGKFPVDSNKLNKIISTLTFNDARAREVLGWKPSHVLDQLYGKI